jgi:hypothetical protein
MSPSPSLDSLSAGHEAFCQKVDSFRAISELLGNTLGLQDVITDKLRDRLVVFNDLFARRVFHGDYDAGQAVINAVDVLNQRVQASGWFKQFPRVLQPAKIDLGEIQRQRTLLNTSLWGDDASAAGMTSHQPSQLTNRRSVSADLSGMVAALQYALNLEMEFRKIPSEPETGFELVDGLTAVSPLIPAAVVALDSKISAEQLADMDDFLRVLLRIKYCEQPATKNCYEYVVYGIIPDGSVKVEELARADLAMHSHCRLLQCLAFIATNEPGIVGERLKVFQEELMLIAIRAIEATMLNYRACMAAHLKMGNVFDQQSLQIALSDLDAMEEAIQVALNNPLEGRPSFGFEDVLQAVRAVRESYSKAALLALSDRELAVRVEEVLAVNHSGPYADQLHEVSARLTDRMRAYLGTKAEEASAQLESLSQGESIIPIVQYAKEMLTIIRADPTSETSAALKKSIGETLLDMLRVLEDYYTGEIALAAKPKASVEDVYRALDALHHLMLEAGYVRDELSPYAEHLPDLLLSKSQILVQEFPKRLKRDLSAASTLLGEVVQNLAREMASPTDSKERSDPDPLKQRAKSCVQGLRWVCMPRRVLPAPVREAFDSLVGARARGVEFS